MPLTAANEPPLRHIELDRPALRAPQQSSASSGAWIQYQIPQMSELDLESQPSNKQKAPDKPPRLASNRIVTAKYTLWSFLPRVLLEQLKRPSNLYFLFMAVLQSIRAVSNTNGYPTILVPLTIVFLCTALKEGLEDRERHRADKVTNSQSILALNANGIWEPKRWGDVQVGDIVRVLQDETVPADIFLLSVDVEQDNSLQREEPNTSGSSVILKGSTGKNEGICYVETKSLDGETNLKVRSAISLLNQLAHTQRGLDELRGLIECESPNPRMNTFEGNISIYLDLSTATMLGVYPNGEELTGNYHLMPRDDNTLAVQFLITPKQMLLRSCILRNTLAVTGIVVFTGHETKVFCSNTDQAIKTSSIEKKLNSLIIRIVMIQQFVCFFGAMMGAVWMMRGGESRWYLGVASDDFSFGELIKLHLRYFIIMQNFVPISLNVSLEFVKYWQAYFMEQDLDMYDEESDTPAIVRSSALNEDLGRVHHVFTDKTGTLTMNLMQFRYCMIGETHYGGPIRGDDACQHSPNGKTQTPNRSRATKENSNDSKYVQFDHSQLLKHLSEDGPQAFQIQRFLRHLALCHTLIPTKSFAETCHARVPEYSASSPDELALVSAAAFCNVRFVHRSPSQMILMESLRDSFLTYKILDTLEFDSERKRMSLIVETHDGDIELLCKGADNVILDRLSSTKRTTSVVENVHTQLSSYARFGLRTLCIAYRKLTRDQYVDWHEKYMLAHSSMEELVKKRSGLPNAIDSLVNEIESELELIGVTAVQDRLQLGVPRTLHMLQRSNIKVWTLTGDKRETAVNIGYACSLLSNNMDVKQIHAEDYTTSFCEIKHLVEVFGGLSEENAGSPAPTKRFRSKETGLKKTLQRICGGFNSVVNGKNHSVDRVTHGGQKRRKRLTMESQISHSFGYQANASMTWGTNGNVNLGSITTHSANEAVESSDSDDQESKRLINVDQTCPRPLLALVIDGKTLEIVLGASSRLQKLFYRLTTLCVCVICCRVSPKQKAQIVQFVSEWEPQSITLAIGDGANDVGMIQMAHIGVGISGLEGAQAVNASDYSISQFRFLQKLLFVHGRWAYRRVTKLMSYMLYKNVTFVLTTFWFGVYSGFSAQPLILDIAAQSFNVLYTSIPVILFAVFDQDVNSRSLREYPHLYSHCGQQNVLLKARVFWEWMLNGVWHSVLLFFSTVSLLHHQSDGEGRSLDGVFSLGFVIFTNLVVVVNWKLLLENHRVTLVFVVTMLCSIWIWLLVSTLVSNSNSSITQAIGVMFMLERAPTIWLGVVIVCLITIFRDLVWKIIVRYALPAAYHILQEREKMHLSIGGSRNNSPKNEKLTPLIVRREELDSPLTQSLIENQMVAEMPQYFRREGLRGRNSGHWQTLEDLTSSHATGPSTPLSSFAAEEKMDSMLIDPETSKTVVPHSKPYYGYAFSQDEHYESDVEAASSSQRRSAKYTHGGENVGAITTKQFVQPVRKILKSVRGRKNA